jgi:BirA family biotin operon repressor/biotin-[acetyl-CoA-carboxylase] ligase
VSEPLDPDRVRERLAVPTRQWLASIEVFESIDSTNTYLMAKAVRESIDGHVCLAEHQSAGRGRRGRTWISPRGSSIAMSLGHRSSLPPARLGPMSLVVGVAVAAALEAVGVDGVQLKWPNDVYLRGAKLGGILIELVPAKQPALAVIGIGINIERNDPSLAEVRDPIAAVSDVVGGVDRTRVCAMLIDSVREHLLRFEGTGFKPFQSEFNRRHVFAGRAVTVSSGAQTQDGVIRGIGAGGELVLETATGRLLVAGGEVTVRAADGLPRGE